QGPDGEVGAVRVEIGAGAEGDVYGGGDRAEGGEGGGGTGRRALRRVARRLFAARVAAQVQHLSTRPVEHGRQLPERRPVAEPPGRAVPLRLPRRDADVPTLPRRVHAELLVALPAAN